MFKFEPYVRSGCHDVLMMSMNIDDIAILNIQLYSIYEVTKSETLNLLQNDDLTKKEQYYENKKMYYHI